jgi:hypothetical protein
MPYERRHVTMTENTFNPRNITGLKVWLDYKQGVYTDTALTTPAVVGNTVKGWYNFANNGYNATEATNPPTLAADGLTFDGSNDVLRLPRLTSEFASGFSYFIVLSATDGRPASTQHLASAYLSAPATTLFFVAIQTNGTIRVLLADAAGHTADGTTTTALADGASSTFVFSMTATPSGNLVDYYNGTVERTVSIASLVWANITGSVVETPFIGTMNIDGSPQQFFAGSIKAFLIYNRVLTTTELTQIHRYLGSRYGVTVA